MDHGNAHLNYIASMLVYCRLLYPACVCVKKPVLACTGWNVCSFYGNMRIGHDMRSTWLVSLAIKLLSSDITTGFCCVHFGPTASTYRKQYELIATVIGSILNQSIPPIALVKLKLS